MKPINITSHIGTDLSGVVDKNVLRNKKVVGKIIEYDPATGVAKYEITDEDCYNEIIGDEVVGVSSRKNNKNE